MLLAFLALLTMVQGTAEAEMSVLHVRDFGAVPDTMVDMGPALREAIAAAKALEGPCRVEFASGIYRVAPAAGAAHALPIHDAHGLTLVGAAGTTCIVVTEPSAGAFDLQDSTNVTLRDLRVDYDPLPYTQGTVVAVDDEGRWFDMRCDESYLTPDAPCFKEAQAPWGLVVATVPEGGEAFGPIPVWTSAWEPTEDGNWRGTISPEKNLEHTGVMPGARLVHMARRYVASAVMAWRCRDIVVENFVVHAAPATASIWAMNENLTIRGLRVERPEQSGRLLSTNADGIHCLGNRGALLIEGCSFEAMADDAINIHARAGVALNQPAPDQLLVSTGGITAYRPVDHIQVYDPEAGRIRHQGVGIERVETTPEGDLLFLDAVVPGVVTGTTFQDGDHIFNLDACGSGAIIRDCTFGLHRGRAILLKTTRSLIEKNQFRNREGWGVAIHQLQGWGEGPAAQDIRIRDNVFQGMGTGSSPFIDIRPSNRNNAPALGRPVRNVRIEGNRMIQPNGAVLRAWAVQGLYFGGNRIEMAPAAAFPILQFHAGGGIRVEDCHIGSLGATDNAAIRVGAKVDSGAQGFVLKDVTLDAGTEVPLLDDQRAVVPG